MSRPARPWAAALLTLALSACGGGSDPPENHLRVSTIVPSLLTPGEVVTVYGAFPPATPAVTLDDAPVTAVPVPGGLRFTLPAALPAGVHRLTLTTTRNAIQATLVVHPRLDAAVLDGQVLSLMGAGWQAASSDLQVEVAGTRHSTRGLNDRELQLTLPRAQAYGPVQVRVWAGGQDSGFLTVARDAGAIRGQLTLPAGEQAPGTRMAAASTPRQKQHLRSPVSRVLVHLSAGSHLPPEFQDIQRDEEPALRAVRLTFASAAQAAAALEKLNRTPGITGTYDYPITLEDLQQPAPPPTPTAPLTPSADQWHLARLDLTAAWTRTLGRGVVVAVVDTGILSTHPDLQERLLPGYNFVDGNTNTTDTYGHGTHVAGLIAAHGHAVGVAPEASLLPVRVIRGQAGGSAFDVARGILYAANLLPELPNPHPAQVINLSLGLDGSSPLIEDAVRQAMAAGVIVVAAAGNTGGALASPATVPGVISVTAVAGPTATYVPAYANWGDGLQVASFGGDLSQDQNHDGTPDGLLSTDLGPGGTPGYGLRNGTSMAAPLVSGLAALTLASGTSAAMTPGVLKGTATDLYVPGYDLRTGMGLPTGRAVTLATPRTYVLALDAGDHLLGWTAAQPDGDFVMGNLPPGEPVRVFAATDSDGDGIVGEAGEEQSPPFTLAVQGSVITTVQLEPLGAVPTPRPITLSARP